MRDALLPLLNSKQLTLPRIDRLINQACTLERSVKRSGRDEITHPMHGHDDLVNAAAGAAACALRSRVDDGVPLVAPLFWSKNNGWSDEAAAVQRGARSAHSSWERWYYNGGRAAPGTIREW
jgi:hypothetical protein